MEKIKIYLKCPALQCPLMKPSKYQAISAEDAKIKIRQFKLELTFNGLISKGNDLNF